MSENLFLSPKIQVDHQVWDKILLLTESNYLIPKEHLQLENLNEILYSDDSSLCTQKCSKDLENALFESRLIVMTSVKKEKNYC